jgi:hypothetical protein
MEASLTSPMFVGSPPCTLLRFLRLKLLNQPEISFGSVWWDPQLHWLNGNVSPKKAQDAQDHDHLGSLTMLRWSTAVSGLHRLNRLKRLGGLSAYLTP